MQGIVQGSVKAKFWDVDDSRAKDWLTKDGKTRPFIGQIGGGLLRMREYTESYPTVYVGQILAYPSYGGPRDRRQRAFDVHLGNQSSRLVSRVRRVHKSHTVTHILKTRKQHAVQLTTRLWNRFHRLQLRKHVFRHNWFHGYIYLYSRCNILKVEIIVSYFSCILRCFRRVK